MRKESDRTSKRGDDELARLGDQSSEQILREDFREVVPEA